MAKIMIVDDDPITRRILVEIVGQAGHEVVQAEDGMHALRLFKESPADLVITDIFMPEKEGLELVRELMEEYPEVKLIAISGGSSLTKFDSLDWVRMFGVKYAFSKPLDRDKILAAIDDLLSDVRPHR